jgi:hypothetical protein
MTLILHLFKKDLRRSSLLIAIWLVLVAVQYCILASSLHPGDRLAQLTYNAISGFGPALGTIVLVVLVAMLVQEEPPAGTSGFWLTRPMSRSGVLGTKALFGALLLVLPALAEVIVLAVAGVTGHDIALAVPEIVLGELQVILVAAVLAALTPNFARFAIAMVVVWVGMYLATLGANWLSTYWKGDAATAGIYVSTLWKSRTIAHDLLIAVGFGAAFAYQYLTRRTGRALAIALVAGLGAIAIDQAWSWDLFPKKSAPPSTVALDLARIQTTLQDTQVQDLAADQSYSRPMKNVGGDLLISGLPEGYVALPRTVQPRLTGADGQVIPARPPRQTNYIYEADSNLFAAVFGKVFVYGRPWFSGTVPSGLVLLDADEFRKQAQERLTFSARIDFDVDHYVVRSRMPLAKGGHAELGSEHEFIADVLRDGVLVDVILHRRYMNLLFSRPTDAFQTYGFMASFDGNRTYVLFNRSRREVIRTQLNSVQLLSGPLQGSRLAQETWQISFGPSNMGLTPDLNDAWLAGAELVELELVPAAGFTRELTAQNFVLEGPNKAQVQPPARPVDPEWLTRFVLPPQPTKTQLKEYVGDLLAASQYWHAESWTELPVTMLAKVGPGNTDVLLGAIDRAWPGTNQAYLLQLAVLRAAGPEDKAAVLRALAANPILVDLVVKFGWQADCRDTLIAALRDERKNSLPRSWLTAVAALRDPATYPDLKAYLIRTHSRQSTYNAIRKLPGIDLRDTIAASWKAAESGTQAEAVDAAAMAVDAGYPDALATLVNVLRQDDVSEPQQITRAMTLVKRYTPATGEAAAVVAWYDANKDRLVFNARRGKFLPAPAPAARTSP